MKKSIVVQSLNTFPLMRTAIYVTENAISIHERARPAVELPPVAFAVERVLVAAREMEQEVNELIAIARAAANATDAEIVLTGILPTLRQSALTENNLTPSARYFALNQAMKEVTSPETARMATHLLRRSLLIRLSTMLRAWPWILTATSS